MNILWVQRVMEGISRLDLPARKMFLNDLQNAVQLHSVDSSYIDIKSWKTESNDTGKYDADATPKVLRVYDSTTRGNMFKLNKDRAKYDLRKFYFTNRVVKSSIRRILYPAMLCQLIL